MSLRLADTHTHFYFVAFDPDRENVLQQDRKSGVQFQIQIGCDEVSSLAAIDLAMKYSDMKCTLGAHPADILNLFDVKQSYRPSGFHDYPLRVRNFPDFFAFLKEQIQQHRSHIVGLGETGFDLYHRSDAEILEMQKYSFSEHLKLCRHYDLPVVIHVRSAKEVLLETLEIEWQKGTFRAVVHCFSEDLPFAHTLTQTYGFSLGIGGVSTYPNAEKIREVIREIPLEFLLTETDAPFLVPQSQRKKTSRNQSAFLTEIVSLISQEKNIPLDVCSEQLFHQAHSFFRVPMSA